MRKKLHISQIEDPFIQANFNTIGEVFNGTPFLKGQWRFIEFQVLATTTGLKVKHNLGFTPKDILVLSSVGGTLVIKYESFDSNFIVFDATVTAAPMTVRAIIGRYSEETIGV